MAKQQPTAQQQEIINSIDSNVAVSAGAGSGKTQVLIGRFMHILETSLQQGLAAQGRYSLNVDQLVAITFTKKAAAEMRSRLRRELNAKLEALEAAMAAGSIDSVRGQLYGDFWRTQLERLPRTHISTIHSLCSYILRENPLEANLDPQFTVAEEYEGKIFVQACLERFVRKALRNNNEHVTALAQYYGLKSFFNHLQLILPNLQEIMAAGDLQQPYRDNLASIGLDKEALCDCLRYMIDNRESFKKPASKTYQGALTNVAANYVELTEAIRQEPANFQPLQDIIQDVKASYDFKEILNRIKELIALIEHKEMDALALPVIAHWQALLDGLYAYVQQEKQAADLLTFDDLEELAIKLLRDYPDVRRKYHQQFAQLMVDEFQDTNDRQRELIYLLCGNSPEKLEGKKLFIVGDPKQSIYRFRGADVSVFKRVQEEIASLKGKCLTMDKNFRSREAVLKAVNSIFAPLMGTDTTQDVFFAPLEPDLPRMEGGEPVSLYTAYYAKDYEGDKDALEAELVVAKILELHEKGIDLGDITILLRSTTKIDVLLAALQAYNVPFVANLGRGFYEKQEVLDLINILTVLHNKYRSIELAGVLRSPYFGLDDETLTKLFLQVEADCLWDALFTADLAFFRAEQQLLMQRAREILASLRQSASTCALGELWIELEKQLEIGAVLKTQPQGLVQLANVAKLGRLIFSFIEEKQGTLGSWLEHVAQLRGYDIKETSATVEAKSAVQLMTFHASKGLQFPIVILPFLEAGENNDTASITFIAPNKLHPENCWGLGIKVLQDDKLADSCLLQQLRAENRRLTFEERKRLLYVATTRAEQQLILFGRAQEDKEVATEDWQQKDWYVQLQSVLPEQADVVREAAGSLAVYLKPLAKQAEQQLDTSSNLLQPLNNYDKLGNTYFSPSALQSFAHCPRYYFYHYGLALPGCPVENNAPVAEAEPLDAAALGLIVHGTLELYSKDAYDVKELERCFALATKAYLGERSADTKAAKTMLEQYLQSSLMPPLAKAEKELAFTLYKDGLEISGVIDCMYENADGRWTIVDYKTGRVPTAAEGKNAGYMYQLSLYRLAAETIFNHRVKTCELHYLQRLTAVGLEDEAEYAHYLTEALEHCHSIGQKPKTEAAFPRSCGQQCAYCDYAYMCK